MSKQNILITGSSGYLGENIILKLFKQKKYQITGIDIKPNKKIEGLIRFVNADISNGETLKENLNDIDVICHCASLTNTGHYTKENYKSTNIDGTMNIYNQAKENAVKKIVLTSSIAAISMDLRNQKWPVNENHINNPNDFYGESKKAQEDIAKTFADKFSIQTIALRPCAFFAVDDHEIGFRLTGSHAVVDDIANAHVAAIDLLLDKQKSENINKFEIIFVTNNLPYKDGDKRLIGTDGKMRKLVSKYWPEGSKFIFELGYKATFFSGVYDLSKAKKILNWKPSFNFNEWFNYCKGKNLTFENIKQKYKEKKSLKNKIFRFFLKIKKSFD